MKSTNLQPQLPGFLPTNNLPLGLPDLAPLLQGYAAAKHWRCSTHVLPRVGDNCAIFQRGGTIVPARLLSHDPEIWSINVEFPVWWQTLPVALDAAEQRLLTAKET